MNRRQFVEQSLLASALLPSLTTTASVAEKQPFYVFSKMFQWIDDYGQLAETVARLGFNGLDLTVRPGGHVLPERVEEDLPKLVEACLSHKLERPMMVTAISEANNQTERILKTAKLLGIRYYRMNWYQYDLKKPIPPQMATLTSKLNELAALNKQYGLIGQYQNHSGNYVGAGIWDIYQMLQQVNSPNLGCQYDINHATYEASGSWQIGFSVIAPHIRSIAVKDFTWLKKADKWTKEGCPLGEGLVDWPLYLSLLRRQSIKGPITMHYEYPLGGAEDGARKLGIPKEDFLKAVDKDLKLAKQWWGAEN